MFASLLFFALVFVAVPVLVAYVVFSFLAGRRAAEFRRLNPSLPVYPQFISPAHVLARLGLIPSFLLSFKPDWDLHGNFEAFKKTPHGALAISTPTQTTVHIANADLVREATTKFPKPLHYYALLEIYGRNVVTTEGDEWKRHRRIAAPQFSEKNNRLVHATTVATTAAMFKGWDEAVAAGPEKAEPSTRVNAGDDMTKLALLVISGAGFGLPLKWEGDGELKPTSGDAKKNTHQLTYKTALEAVVQYMTMYLIIPKSLYVLPIRKLEEIRLGFSEFKVYMEEMVQGARAEVAKKGKDAPPPSNLLSSLIAASAADSNDGKSGLSESELLGNMFILLFAGHETTAGTLQYALALLAVYPEEQRRLYEDVRKVFPESACPKYSEFPKLAYSLAIMNETLRMYPPVLQIPKWTADSSEQTLGPYHLPSGTYLEINTSALHHNPEHWGADHDTFRPERFLPAVQPQTSSTPAAAGPAASTASGKFERYAFAPFSEGGRMCLGKKFSQVEFVCALSMIARRYTWRLADGITPTEVFEPRKVITLRPARPTFLEFTRRLDAPPLPTEEQAKTAGSS